MLQAQSHHFFKRLQAFANIYIKKMAGEHRENGSHFHKYMNYALMPSCRC